MFCTLTERIHIPVYVDASDSCNDLTFAIGTASATRTWSIKITQFNCAYENLVGLLSRFYYIRSITNDFFLRIKAPSGCTQYYFDTTATGTVKTFNFDNGIHLANQRQKICIRKAN